MVKLEIDYKRLLEGLHTAVILIDRELRIRYMNAAAENLLDVSARKACRHRLDELFTGAHEDGKEIQAALENGNRFIKRRVELRLMHGKLLHVDYAINPVEIAGAGFALMEINSLEHAHRFSREELLSTANSTSRELVRGLAHEIKNPLGGIRGAAQLLAQELDDEELTDYTGVIIEEADRLRNLVERMMGSRRPLDMRPVNIHEILERVRSLVEAESLGSGIGVSRDYDPSIPDLMGDEEQLIQALLNIACNALQSLDNPDVNHDMGSILFRSRVVRNVTFAGMFHRLAANIEIIDNGPGIRPDMLESIFYPMISGRANGTGLGLSIANAIVNQHRGFIECESEPGRTCFSLMLPIEQDDY